MPTSPSHRTAAAALADDDDDHRNRQARHFAQIVSDGLGLPALFGVEAGISAQRVHQSNDGTVELRGQFHHAHGLAIALGFGHAPVAEDLLLSVAAFLLADHHHRTLVEPAHACYDGVVVGKEPVAMNLTEVREQALDVIERMPSLGVTRQLHAIPTRIARSGCGGVPPVWATA